MNTTSSGDNTNIATKVDQSDPDWIAVKNETKSHTLFYQDNEGTAKNPHPSIQFYIIDDQDKKIYEHVIHGGYVKWIDENRVEFFSVPGIMRPGETLEDIIKVYDIELNRVYYKKRKINKY